MSLEEVLDQIMLNLSGERAKRLTGILSQYHRIQASKEFLDSIEFIKEELVRLGDSDYNIHEYIADGTKRYYEWNSPLSWNIEDGKLLLIEPKEKILCDFSETPESICTHSKSVKLEAEVVHVGEATVKELTSKDLKGKIVLTSGKPRTLIEKLHNHGVIGLIAYPSEERANGYQQMIQYVGLWPNADNVDKSTFGFSISRKQALEILDYIKKDKKVLVKAKIDANLNKGKMHVLSTKITGSLRPEEEIILIAHICHPSPSANDNASGSALLLEMYRTIRDLIEKGKIEKPHRTLRFLWVPEFYGTLPWIQEKLTEESFKPHICMNFDMCGEHPALVGYPFTFNASSVSTPSYLNDIVSTIISKVKDNPYAIEQGGWQFPWNCRIASFSGGSDQVIFNDEPTRIPSVMFGHSDTFHHTNLDTIEKVDSTTLKRVGITGATAAILISNTNLFNSDIIKSYFRGYHSRKGKFVSMILEEIQNSKKLEEEYKERHFIIMKRVVQAFIDYEKLIIDEICADFDNINNDLLKLLEIDRDTFQDNTLKLIVELSGLENTMKETKDMEKIPKRKWIGPLETSHIFKISREDFSDENLSHEQTEKLKDFVKNSMANYGGIIHELVNLINGERNILEIISFLSLAQWKIPQIETIIIFFEYLINSELIAFDV